jgi:hypothetical protein
VSAFVINPYSFVGDNITAFEFLQATADNGNLTTYTFTGVNFGSADANRRIVIGVLARASAIGRTVSSATIGGVSATILSQQDLNLSGAGYNVHAYLTADVPNGTSGTVAITLAAGALRLQIATYRVISNAALVLADSKSKTSGASGSATSESVSVAAENGIVLASAASVQSSVLLSVSGIANTDSNSVVESVVNVLFASERTTATATQTITATLSSGTLISLVGVCLK